jgi:hypothetical protein
MHADTSRRTVLDVDMPLPLVHDGNIVLELYSNGFVGLAFELALKLPNAV